MSWKPTEMVYDPMPNSKTYVEGAVTALSVFRLTTKEFEERVLIKAKMSTIWDEPTSPRFLEDEKESRDTSCDEANASAKTLGSEPILNSTHEEEPVDASPIAVEVPLLMTQSKNYLMKKEVARKEPTSKGNGSEEEASPHKSFRPNPSQPKAGAGVENKIRSAQEAGSPGVKPYVSKWEQIFPDTHLSEPYLLNEWVLRILYPGKKEDRYKFFEVDIQKNLNESVVNVPLCVYLAQVALDQRSAEARK